MADKKIIERTVSVYTGGSLEDFMNSLNYELREIQKLSPDITAKDVWVTIHDSNEYRGPELVLKYKSPETEKEYQARQVREDIIGKLKDAASRKEESVTIECEQPEYRSSVARAVSSLRYCADREVGNNILSVYGEPVFDDAGELQTGIRIHINYLNK